jgi:hypothetical protein
MTIRAKFRVTNIERQDSGDTNIFMNPVVGGSEENDAFFSATPAGNINIFTVNPEAGNQFEIGMEFYVDFTPAQ